MIEEVSFVPAAITAKERTSNRTGEKFTAYGIVSTDGKWFNTLNSDLATECAAAKDKGLRVRLQYEVKKGFNNIKDVKIEERKDKPQEGVVEKFLEDHEPKKEVALAQKHDKPIETNLLDARQHSIEKQVAIKCAVEREGNFLAAAKTVPPLKVLYAEVAKIMGIETKEQTLPLFSKSEDDVHFYGDSQSKDCAG